MNAAEALARAIVTKRDWNDSELSGVLATIVEKYSETIARLRALGFAIVPVEATKEMIAAGDMLTYREERFRVSAVWREMVSAYAPDAEKGKL